MEPTVFKIDYEKYELSNGLQVILHEDPTDPIVAVAILYHVGSSREKPGKTGFAHFFEHMLFQNSEHVGKGNFFKIIEDAGGTMNGGTWQDGTVYYEVVPKNALERILWMESDRMGFMINTVTTDVLENEKEVVKNEKRQRVDNQPYGHTNYVIHQALYPSDHPYNWQVIGSMEDLNAADLNDVKAFYADYYGPNNASLVIAGDIDKIEVKSMVQHYFGEIPSRGTNTRLEIKEVVLKEELRLFHEDHLSNLPELTLTYPTVEETHPDFYALSFLGSILASGKRAPLFKEIVEKQKLAPRVYAGNQSMELAGKFTIKIKAYTETDLNLVYEAIQEAFKRFEEEGINEKDLQKVKNAQEIEFYQSISSALGKSFQLAQYNVFRGEPSKLEEEVQALMKVTQADVLRVYHRYIQEKPAVLTSFVPKGNQSLALRGSVKADVVVEEISDQPMVQAPLLESKASFQKTPSSFDRSLRPPLGQIISTQTPAIWQDSLPNNLNLLGIQDVRLPIAEFSIRLLGGMSLDRPERIGVANLITDVMMEGTENKTPEELQDAIHQLGSTIQMYTAPEFIEIHASTLTRNFEPTLDLVREILLEPRWDQKEFERARNRTLNDINLRNAKPNVLANQLFKKLVYGDHILGNPSMGKKDVVATIELHELQSFYQTNFVPELAHFHLAGALSYEMVIDQIKSLEPLWNNSNHRIMADKPETLGKGNSLHFIDVPGAMQSVLCVGKLGIQSGDPDFDILSFINYKLGGNFNSLLNTQLREERGYTYGVNSQLSRRINTGTFLINTSVHAQATMDSIRIIRDTMHELSSFFTEQEVNHIRQVIARSKVRSFETLFQKLNMLENISTYQLPLDYIDKTLKLYDSLTPRDIRRTIQKHLDVDSLVYVVAGDAQTQFEHVRSLGFEQVNLIDKADLD